MYCKYLSIMHALQFYYLQLIHLIYISKAQEGFPGPPGVASLTMDINLKHLFY